MYLAAEFTISWVAYFSCDGIELKNVKVQSNPGKSNFKDIEDKPVEQLVREVRKLQEQLVSRACFEQSETLKMQSFFFRT